MPSGWEEYQNEDGDYYYYNAITKETVWDRPTDIAESKPIAKPKVTTPPAVANASPKRPPAFSSKNTTATPTNIPPTENKIPPKTTSAPIAKAPAIPTRSVTVSDGEKKCPNCGAMGTGKFCTKCGTPMGTLSSNSEGIK